MTLRPRNSIERRRLILSIAIAVATGSAISVRGHALQLRTPQADQPIPPLIEAIWNRDAEKVEQLLAHGADPKATIQTVADRDRPAWVWAIIAGDDRTTALLLSKLKTVDRLTRPGHQERQQGGRLRLEAVDGPVAMDFPRRGVELEIISPKAHHFS